MTHYQTAPPPLLITVISCSRLQEQSGRSHLDHLDHTVLPTDAVSNERKYSSYEGEKSVIRGSVSLVICSPISDQPGAPERCRRVDRTHIVEPHGGCAGHSRAEHGRAAHSMPRLVRVANSGRTRRGALMRAAGRGGVGQPARSGQQAGRPDTTNPSRANPGGQTLSLSRGSLPRCCRSERFIDRWNESGRRRWMRCYLLIHLTSRRGAAAPFCPAEPSLTLIPAPGHAITMCIMAAIRMKPNQPPCWSPLPHA